mmetsp:Transcript_63205/g.150727  ORF Transcript_63205/g.150727 Transcript_63205/m.150727 type:complete len:317 (-) Transcript_63205:84-1034(-)
MHHGGSGLGAPLDLLFCQSCHVHCDQSVVQHAHPLEVGQRGALLVAHVTIRAVPIACGTGLALCRGLVQVDVDWAFELLAQRLDLLQSAFRACVGGVRRDRPRDEVLSEKSLSCCATLCEVVIWTSAVAGEGELDGDDSYGRSDSGPDYGLRDGLGKPIHLIEGRRAAPDHLQDCELSALLHEVRLHKLALCWPNHGLKPLAERYVIGDAAQKHHGTVRVRIHEARQKDLPGQVGPGLRRVLPPRGIGRQNVHDHAVLENHGVVLQSFICLHWHHPTGTNDFIHLDGGHWMLQIWDVLAAAARYCCAISRYVQTII